jgi:uncharacterized protein YecE (DUF72 family)
MEAALYLERPDRQKGNSSIFSRQGTVFLDEPESPSPMDIRIGCSGYYYPYWKNRFYPKGLAPKNWLAYYSSVFNTVELNGTFYRLPKLMDLKRQSEATPNDFRFSVKAHRLITHLKRLNGVRQEIADFQDLILSGFGDKLACILYQLPPSFRFTDENLERVLSTIPKAKNNVVEFRHESWWCEAARIALANVNLTLCNVDFPGLTVPTVHTSPLFYMRFHGNPELFKSTYQTSTLVDFQHSLPTNLDSCFVYFNNTYFEGGFTNALQLMQIASRSRQKQVLDK